MSLSLVQGRALVGLTAPAVTIEVHLANGLPSFTLVGLADVEVKEARERVRSALQNAGLEFPHNQRITVNLAPADLPKDSGRFDLPIALGILAAAGLLDAQQLDRFEFAGEQRRYRLSRKLPGHTTHLCAQGFAGNICTDWQKLGSENWTGIEFTYDLLKRDA
jgi:magnesium chelatase family protein